MAMGVTRQTALKRLKTLREEGLVATAMGGRRGVQGSTKARSAEGPAPVVEGTGALSALCLIMSG